MKKILLLAIASVFVGAIVGCSAPAEGDTTKTGTEAGKDGKKVESPDMSVDPSKPTNEPGKKADEKPADDSAKKTEEHGKDDGHGH